MAIGFKGTKIIGNTLIKYDQKCPNKKVINNFFKFLKFLEDVLKIKNSKEISHS